MELEIVNIPYYGLAGWGSVIQILPWWISQEKLACQLMTCSLLDGVRMYKDTSHNEYYVKLT